MADTTTDLTTNYELKKPAQSGSVNHWGTELNTNFDTIDTKLVPTSTTASNGGQVLTASSNTANAFSWEDSVGASSLNELSDTTVSTTDPATDSNPPATGHLWINKTSGKTYVCTNATDDVNTWVNSGDGEGAVQPYTVATGGTIAEDGDYKIHTFLASSLVSSSDGFRVSTLGSAPHNTVEYLVVGAGGGAGGHFAGGGGAGGYRTATGFSISASTNYDVIIEAGGAGGINSNHGVNGGVSTFGTITSAGGGSGGYRCDCSTSANSDGSDGGSGGGGGGEDVGTNAAGSATNSSYGNNGGTGGSGGVDNAGGGGGGAGTAGSNGAYRSGGNGGNGLTSDIVETGTNVTRAGGGGGGSYQGTGGTGGTGGGGDGTTTNSGTNGDANKGAGGGGGGSYATGGQGGKGVVIIRYKFK